jgi:glyceraldehyde-3-phosphate dehydrogenase/erythrose-4-phosphate dehydrogenase
MTRVAVNRFGRIERNHFRTYLERGSRRRAQLDYAGAF